MGFVAWLDPETLPPAVEDCSASVRPEAAELERHVEIVRTTRELAPPPAPVADEPEEPEPPLAA